MALLAGAYGKGFATGVELVGHPAAPYPCLYGSLASGRVPALAAVPRFGGGSLSKWPIGGLAVAGLELVGLARQLVQGEPEGSCDAIGHCPCGIGDAALEPPNGCGVEVGGVRQGLLGQSDRFSAKPDRPAEGDLGVPADPHARTLRAQSTAYQGTSSRYCSWAVEGWRP